MSRTTAALTGVALMVFCVAAGTAFTSKPILSESLERNQEWNNTGFIISRDSDPTLAEEEKELDKEMDEEITKVKKDSFIVTKKPKLSIKNATFSAEQTCNSASQMDLSLPGSLALCTCGAHEVLVNGSCTSYPHGLTIDAEYQFIRWQETPVSKFQVRVQALACESDVTHQHMTFEKGAFFLRNRGDVVLTGSAGALAGLRIADYCVDHFLDQEGNLSWKMKACIPHPSVPRCCPPGQIFRNGTCRTGPSPTHLSPTIHPNPMGSGNYSWPVIENHINTIKCETQSPWTLALDIHQSFLIGLPTGVTYLWRDPSNNIKFFFCPTFCVDGIQSVDGTVDYTANFCYTPGAERTEVNCTTDKCIRKCCEEGKVMSIDHYKCIETKDAIFTPPVRDNLTDYEIVTGLLTSCSFQSREEAVDFIDPEGNLHFKEKMLGPNAYCIDTFSHQGSFETHAFVCERMVDPLWWKVRPILLPICSVISLIFLSITVGFFIIAPVLLKQGGWHMLSYVLSLMVAYGCVFSSTTYHPQNTSCVALAILMQFGFLATFFWLCIMCFDIERKIRSLRQCRMYVPYHPAAYLAAGFGIPILICTTTVIMLTTVPYGTQGVVVPSIGISRCWFDDDLETLVYFYGPIAILFICNIGLIASTAWNYKKIEKIALGIQMKSKTETEKKVLPPVEYERQKQTTKNFEEFKTKFSLMTLMCICWIAEILSWKIPPIEIWAFTDVLNSLQGFFIFVIFLSYRKNRKTLKRLHPKLYAFIQPFINILRKIRNFLLPKKSTPSSGEAAGRSREPSISSEYSDLSDNYKPPEPVAA